MVQAAVRTSGPAIQTISVASLMLDGETQARASMNQERIDEFAALIRDKSPVPPIVVFRDGERHWIADGFHRAHGAIKAGRKNIDADVRIGTKADCIRYAVAANRDGDTTSLRRTNADKRRCVEMMLALLKSEKQNWSSSMVAEHCGVNPSLVDRIRPTLNGGGDDPMAPRLTKNGRMMRPVGNPKPKPDSQPPESGVVETVSAEVTPDSSKDPKTNPSWRKGKRDDKTLALDKQVAELHAEGMGTGDIARAVGADPHEVSASKGRQGLIRRNNNPLTNLTHKAIEQASAWEIAEEYADGLWEKASVDERSEFADAIDNLVRTAKRFAKQIADNGRGSSC